MRSHLSIHVWLMIPNKGETYILKVIWLTSIVEFLVGEKRWRKSLVNLLYVFLMSHIQNSVFMGPALSVPFMLLAIYGLGTGSNHIPPLIRLGMYGSYLRYGLEGKRISLFILRWFKYFYSSRFFFFFLTGQMVSIVYCSPSRKSRIIPKKKFIVLCQTSMVRNFELLQISISSDNVGFTV